MFTAKTPQHPTVPSPEMVVYQWPGDAPLAEQSSAFASKIYDQIAEQYLAFRRVYYEEEHPSLAVLPPQGTRIHRAQIAQFADHSLQMLPSALKATPLFGGVLEHLQQVVNIHSMSEHERTELHNATMFFLHGIKDGIQPWYVNWLLSSAQRLSAHLPATYFMTYPWDALYYLNPVELRVFEAVVATGDVSGAEHVIERLGQRFSDALDNPIERQADLAFTGPNAEASHASFNLKTAATLALAGLFIAGEAKSLLDHSQNDANVTSQLAPPPPEMTTLFTQRRENQP